jgi:hypothetical protein
MKRDDGTDGGGFESLAGRRSAMPMVVLPDPDWRETAADRRSARPIP